MLSEKGGRKAGEVSDVAFVKSKLEGRESRGEEGGQMQQVRPAWRSRWQHERIQREAWKVLGLVGLGATIGWLGFGGQ